MKYNKIMLVFGTRPEAIKMAPVYKILKESEYFSKVMLCVTGQHRQMLDQVLDIFNLIPDYDLNIMKDGQDLVDITSKVLLGMREILINEKPDLLLVHGDTTTAMASSLAAFYCGVSVGHIEAGLRTNNIYSPFPEEFNRQVISKIASLHFAPTRSCCNNLINEGISENIIHATGNTVIDALHLVLSNIKNNVLLEDKINKLLENLLGEDWQAKKIVLITGHRRENFGAGFIKICESIRILAKDNLNILFVYPVHLNPNVLSPVNEYLGGLENVKLIPPLGYEEFAYLMQKSFMILTDSGGIQEEAPSLGKPVVVFRDTTERPEAVDAGTVILVGTDSSRIVATVSDLLSSSSLYENMSRSLNPYGNGDASTKILEVLISCHQIYT